MDYVYILKVMKNVKIWLMDKLSISNKIVRNVLLVRIKDNMYKINKMKNIVLAQHLINNIKIWSVY